MSEESEVYVYTARGALLATCVNFLVAGAVVKYFSLIGAFASDKKPINKRYPEEAI